MVYSPNWIEKNMGITRKAQRLYEKKGFLKPNRNSTNRYREYSKEDLERIWYIKLYVELGYSLDEIANMIDNPDFDFRDSIVKKIEILEKEKRKLEQLINYAKQIKLTGIMPTVPQEMGSIKFEGFLENAHRNWNIEADSESAILYDMVEYAISKLEPEWDEEDIIQLFKSIITKSDSNIDEIDADRIKALSSMMKETFSNMEAILIQQSYYKKLASLSHFNVSHPDVQELVKQMYDFEREYFFSSYADRMTPQWYATHVPAYFSGSDIAILNEQKYGKENCEFIVKAIEYFGGVAESNNHV